MLVAYSLAWRLRSQASGIATSCLPKPLKAPKSIVKERAKAMNYFNQHRPLYPWISLFRRQNELTHARTIHQSSAVPCFTIPSRLTKRATTNMVAGMKVEVVTTKTALEREWEPSTSDLGSVISSWRPSLARRRDLGVAVKL